MLARKDDDRWKRPGWRVLVWAVWLLLCGLLVAMGDAAAWRERSAGLRPPIHSLATLEQRWLAGGEGRAYWSVDAGATWRALPLVGTQGAAGATKGSLPDAPAADVEAPEDARGLGARARQSMRSAGEGLREEVRGRSGEAEATRRSGAGQGAAAVAPFVHAALTEAVGCVGGERSLYCGEPRRSPSLRRIPLPSGARVRALAAVWGEGAPRRGAIAIATDAGLFLLTRTLALQPVQLPEPPLDALGGEAGALWVRTSRALLLLRLAATGEAAASEQVVPLPARFVGARLHPRARAVAERAGEVYVGFRRTLWRREGGGFVQVPAPPGELRALRACGRRLFALARDGVHQLGAFGWTRIAVGMQVRATACAQGRLLVAGDDGLWQEERAQTPAVLQDLELSAWTPAPWPRFARRARLAAWAPELELAGRLVAGSDARTALPELRWPSVDVAPSRWHHDPVLRLRGTSRAEAWLVLRWPFGRGGAERSLHSARREDRRLARRWLVSMQRAFALHRRLGRAHRGRAPDLRTAVARRLRVAEATALVRAYSLGSAS